MYVPLFIHLRNSIVLKGKSVLLACVLHVLADLKILYSKFVITCSMQTLLVKTHTIQFRFYQFTWVKLYIKRCMKNEIVQSILGFSE